MAKMYSTSVEPLTSSEIERRMRLIANLLIDRVLEDHKKSRLLKLDKKAQKV